MRVSLIQCVTEELGFDNAQEKLPHRWRCSVAAAGYGGARPAFGVKKSTYQPDHKGVLKSFASNYSRFAWIGHVSRLPGRYTQMTIAFRARACHWVVFWAECGCNRSVPGWHLAGQSAPRARQHRAAPCFLLRWWPGAKRAAPEACPLLSGNKQGLRFAALGEPQLLRRMQRGQVGGSPNSVLSCLVFFLEFSTCPSPAACKSMHRLTSKTPV